MHYGCPARAVVLVDLVKFLILANETLNVQHFWQAGLDSK
jgi:hypothetical protein